MKNSKRIFAILGIIILLGSIIAICTLLTTSNNLSEDVIRGLVSCLVAIPIVAYGYSILLKYSLRLKNNIQADTTSDKDQD